MESKTSPQTLPADIAQQTTEIVEQVNEYGSMIINGLYLIIGGMLAVYLLYKLASKAIYPHVKDTRHVKVIFGTLYVLVLVITALLAFKQLGFDVNTIGKIVLTCVLIGAVVVFFLVPFFPRLPFKTGHMVELKGVLGIVESISAFHTKIRKLDGTMAFIPNSSIMTSEILNYSHIPIRRIEMQLSVNVDCDLEQSKKLFLRIMNEDKRVMNDPTPTVNLVSANAAGVDILAFCWAKNEDWFGARSDLWLKVVDGFMSEDRVAMSLPQQEVYVIDGNSQLDENKQSR
jgi:small conductance mechanosensitive channel